MRVLPLLVLVGCGQTTAATDAGDAACATTVLGEHSSAGGRLLFADATDVYWMADALLLRTPKTGGATTVIDLPDGGNAWVVATDGDRVLLVSSTTLGAIPKSGGAYTIVESGLPPFAGIAVGSDRIYWASPATIVSFSKSGGPPNTLVDGRSGIGGVLTDDVSIFWSEGAALFTVPVGGGDPRQLASPIRARSTVLNRMSIVWTDWEVAGGPASLFVLPKTGGTPVRLEGGDGLSLAADDGAAYVSSQNSALRVPLDGSPATRVAGAQRRVDGLALDDSALYFGAVKELSIAVERTCK